MPGLLLHKITKPAYEPWYHNHQINYAYYVPSTDKSEIASTTNVTQDTQPVAYSGTALLS